MKVSLDLNCQPLRKDCQPIRFGKDKNANGNNVKNTPNTKDADLEEKYKMACKVIAALVKDAQAGKKLDKVG